MTVELSWNKRYETSKLLLVRRLVALMSISDRGDLARARQTIRAVLDLPNVGDYKGSVSIENKVAKNLGDSDFIYSLFVREDGFELSYFEYMNIGCGQRDHTGVMTLVQCYPKGCEADENSVDIESIENMREYSEMLMGRSFDDEEWQTTIESASETDQAGLPNGINSWLEMLPVSDDGECPETITVRWGE